MGGLLVIGSDGLVGRRAAAMLPGCGWQLITASHVPGKADLTLDLTQPGAAEALEELPEGVDHALFCAGLTKVDEVARNPERSQAFNVTHTIEVLRPLMARGIKPVFLSSDLVFKGDRGDYREEDPRLPETVYGRQKLAVENFLIGHGERPSLIVRASKLYSLGPEDTSPIRETIDALRRGEIILAARDQTICPTWVNDLIGVIDLLLRQGRTGAFHVSAPQSFSRLEMATLIACYLNRMEQVRPCSIHDFSFFESRPVNSGLNVEKCLAATGWRFKRLPEALSAMIHNHDEMNKP